MTAAVHINAFVSLALVAALFTPTSVAGLFFAPHAAVHPLFADLHPHRAVQPMPSSSVLGSGGLLDLLPPHVYHHHHHYHPHAHHVFDDVGVQLGGHARRRHAASLLDDFDDWFGVLPPLQQLQLQRRNRRRRALHHHASLADPQRAQLAAGARRQHHRRDERLMQVLRDVFGVNTERAAARREQLAAPANDDAAAAAAAEQRALDAAKAAAARPPVQPLRSPAPPVRVDTGAERTEKIELKQPQRAQPALQQWELQEQQQAPPQPHHQRRRPGVAEPLVQTGDAAADVDGPEQLANVDGSNVASVFDEAFDDDDDDDDDDDGDDDNNNNNNNNNVVDDDLVDADHAEHTEHTEHAEHTEHTDAATSTTTSTSTSLDTLHKTPYTLVEHVDDDALVVRAFVPGLRRRDVQVRLDVRPTYRELIVRAPALNWHPRAVSLPLNTGDRVEAATLHDGVLSVRVPLAQPSTSVVVDDDVGSDGDGDGAFDRSDDAVRCVVDPESTGSLAIEDCSA